MIIVYILFSNSLNKFYVGQTNNFDRRFHEHNSRQTKYSSIGIPWNLVYKTETESRSEAMKLETKIKKRGILRYLKGLGVV
jgi:putative endonuclease